MSVPVNKRTQGKLEVCVQAHDLACYTLQITKNKNVFSEDYQEVLTNKIIQAALDIHLCVWSANNVLVKTPEDYQNRRQLQDTACIRCNVLLSLIDIAKSIFHLSGKRVHYWGSKVVTTRNLIRAWRESDYKRYKDIGM